MSKTLEQLTETLEKAGYPAQLVRGNTDTAEHLQVQLGSDGQGRQRRLDLTFASAAHDVMKASGALAAGGDGGYDEIDYLQFFMRLPFAVQPDFLIPVAQLVLHLNADIPLVGFGVDPAEPAVYFRHMMITAGQQVDERLVREAVETIAFLAAEFSQPLEDVALGGKFLEQVLAEL